MIQGIRTYRTPTAALQMRQQVAATGSEAASPDLLRSAAVFLLATSLIVFAVSQFLHWRIDNQKATLEQLHEVRESVGSDNIRLLAQRARLMSENHVQAVVATRLQLFRPEKGQMHRL